MEESSSVPVTPGRGSGRSEWKRYGTLPLAAALGHSIAVLHVYTLGAFMEPLQRDFDWSRAQISSGIMIVGLLGALLSVPVGALVDKVGPRVVGLAGAAAMTGSFALLGTATGGSANWIMLWILIAFANLGLQATVLVTAVSRRFEASRGLAFAVTLSGASLGAIIFPVLATGLIGAFGWRTAFFALGGIWALVAFPVMALFFRTAPRNGSPGEKTAAPADLPGISVREGLRSPAFYKLAIASGLFTFTSLGIIVHFVPILTGVGADPLTAAQIASIIGVAALFGRLGTGILLDHFSARLVGGTILLLPLMSCILLLFAGPSAWGPMVAALGFGLSLGAEIDVVAYLATRQFGMRNYGTLFGFINGCLALGVAAGPVLAGAAFDQYGSYAPFLYLAIGGMAISSLSLFTLPPPRFTSRNSPA